MNLRFISTPQQKKELTAYFKRHAVPVSPASAEIEIIALSLFVIRKICEENAVAFSIIDITEFLEKQPKDGISLLLDAELEPIMYSPFWNMPFSVDGEEVFKAIGDKYKVYRMISGIHGVIQPKAVAIRSHRDFFSALTQMDTEKIVIKPRYSGYASRNLIMIAKNRFSNTDDVDADKGERFNFTDCIMQEYLPSTRWPPREIRFHFVGRELCRCLSIIDKNNWSKAFEIRDIPRESMPENLIKQAFEISKTLVHENCKDNLTVDFLELNEKGKYIFLEANCGNLTSFYISKNEDEKFLRDIFLTLFKKYFSA